MENKQTLGEWLNENKKDAIAVINGNLTQGRDWQGKSYVVKGRSKRDCYREVNKILKINIIEELKTMDLKYDDVPLLFSGMYDQTSNDTTSRRDIDFYVHIDKLLKDDDEDSKGMIIAEFGIVVDVKLKKTSNATNSYLVKDFSLTSSDKPLKEMVGYKLEQITKQHNEANDNLLKRVGELKVELQNMLDSLNKGEYKLEGYWLTSLQKYVKEANEKAQNSINFFKTIEQIKLRMNK